MGRHEKIVRAAAVAHRSWRESNSQSEGNKLAKQIDSKWKEDIRQIPGVEIEVCPCGNLNERIDAVDKTERIAYELKSSGNNPEHEFYKDIVKIMLYNRAKASRNRIKKFCFLCPRKGENRLRSGMAGVLSCETVAQNFIRFAVEIISIEDFGSAR